MNQLRCWHQLEIEELMTIAKLTWRMKEKSIILAHKLMKSVLLRPRNGWRRGKSNWDSRDFRVELPIKTWPKMVVRFLKRRKVLLNQKKSVPGLDRNLVVNENRESWLLRIFHWNFVLVKSSDRRNWTEMVIRSWPRHRTTEGKIWFNQNKIGCCRTRPRQITEMWSTSSEDRYRDGLVLWYDIILENIALQTYQAEPSV